MEWEEFYRVFEEKLKSLITDRYSKIDDQQMWIHPSDIQARQTRVAFLAESLKKHGATLEEKDARTCAVLYSLGFDFGYENARRHLFGRIRKCLPELF